MQITSALPPLSLFFPLLPLSQHVHQTLHFLEIITLIAGFRAHTYFLAQFNFHSEWTEFSSQ